MVHTAIMLPKGAEMHPKGVAISEGGEIAIPVRSQRAERLRDCDPSAISVRSQKAASPPCPASAPSPSAECRRDMYL
eukprot:scaffold3886_cov36-Phaeocystis_antarctica.AAC.1